MAKRKKPIDVQELAAQLAQAQADGKDPLAVMLGRRGGLKGGHARAKAMTPEQRSYYARLAARARWSTRKDA